MFEPVMVKPFIMVLVADTVITGFAVFEACIVVVPVPVDVKLRFALFILTFSI